jgi:hypothetical protein
VLRLFGDAARGEFAWVECNAILAPISQWTRIDYTWRWRDGKPTLMLYDINLLPGMTFISAKIAEICQELFADHDLGGAEPMPSAFNTRLLIDAVREHFEKASRGGPEPLRIAVLGRSQHGLGCDAELCVRSVEEVLQRGEVVAMTAPALRVRLATESADGASGVRTSGIIRMARPVSKHSAGEWGATEDEAFRDLAIRLQTGPPVFPSFNAYLENHAWFAIWQGNEFGAFAKRRDALEILEAVKALLPKTGVVTPNGDLICAEGAQRLSSDHFAANVVKRGNSTGGRDLAVLNHASRGQRRAALARVAAEPSGGWVIQELIEPRKETFPVFNDNDDVVLQTGFMVYSAYYCGGKYVGGHAVMSPHSRKVHGGFGSLLVPMRVL